MLKAKFKTAYGQREIPMDVAVVGTSDLAVGQLVTLTAANGSVPAYISAATTVAAATHIIAQSDMTMEYGHIPVEDRNYTYSDKVAPTASTATASSATKKVALFEVDKNDIVTYTVS